MQWHCIWGTRVWNTAPRGAALDMHGEDLQLACSADSCTPSCKPNCDCDCTCNGNCFYAKPAVLGNALCSAVGVAKQHIQS